MFLVDNRCKEGIFFELTATTLRSLICDPKASVQEQALGHVRNLVDGPIDSMEYVFVEDGLLLHAVGRQLQSDSKTEVLIQKPNSWNLQAVQVWFQTVIATKDFIYFIYCLTFATSKISLKFALLPILCRALEHVAKFLRKANAQVEII